MTNDQEKYAYLGAKWLFEQMGGKGDVFYMRGARRRTRPTMPATSASSRPWPSSRTSRSPRRSSPAGSRTKASSRSLTSSPAASPSTASGPRASTTSSSTRWSRKASSSPSSALTTAQFVQYLGTVEGLKGAAVTNPGSVGGAGVTLALQILNGELPAVPADEASRMVTVDSGRSGRTSRRGPGRPVQGSGRPRSRQRVAGRHLDPGLDHLRSGQAADARHIATGIPFDGVWTSGIDNVIVDALVDQRRRSCRSSAPTTPASCGSSARSRASGRRGAPTPARSAAPASRSRSRS